ncbi:MAG TPA: phage protein GemA/Gp16 family protein [Bryobacteraceae bacterium]|nr:phage protein GemA/Gp16 family protein [Bryobacteraceae bacterium]
MPRASRLDQPVDVSLLRAIHACARENGCDNEGLHEAIESGFGKTSLKDLTRAEAYALLDGLRAGKPSEHYKPNPRRRHAQGNHGRRAYDASSDAIYPVRDAERQLLRDAAALRNWDEAQLSRFIERQIGKLDVTTMADFNKVFWPLKSMNRRDGRHR